MEPMEKVFLDIPDDKVGIITEKLSERKGRMTNLVNHGHGRVSMDFYDSIPGVNRISQPVLNGYTGCWNHE